MRKKDKKPNAAAGNKVSNKGKGSLVVGHGSIGAGEKSVVITGDVTNTKINISSSDHSGDSGQRVKNAIRNFSPLIDEKVVDFTGRRSLIKLVNDCLQNKQKGYLRLRGDPGIGKTSVSAHFVKENNWIHHFISRSAGDNHPENILESLCAQIVQRYNLDTSIFGDGNLKSFHLTNVLIEASKKTTAPIVVLVDGLDEIDKMPSGFNTGYMPGTLADGVFFFITYRAHDPRVKLDINDVCEMSLIGSSQENMQDVREFLAHTYLTKLSLKTFLKQNAISQGSFVDILSEKSEGNFMYLKHVLDDIVKGAYSDLKAKNLSTGLTGYYQNHLDRMKSVDESVWDQFILPILGALCLRAENSEKDSQTGPITLGGLIEICGFSKEDEPKFIRILQNLSPFICEQTISSIKGYTFYHASFADFLSKNQEIQFVMKKLQIRQRVNFFNLFKKG